MRVCSRADDGGRKVESAGQPRSGAEAEPEAAVGTRGRCTVLCKRPGKTEEAVSDVRHEFLTNLSYALFD